MNKQLVMILCLLVAPAVAMGDGLATGAGSPPPTCASSCARTKPKLDGTSNANAAIAQMPGAVTGGAVSTAVNQRPVIVTLTQTSP